LTCTPKLRNMEFRRSCASATDHSGGCVGDVTCDIERWFIYTLVNKDNYWNLKHTTLRSRDP
jgi:hypothetical protein